MKRFDRQIAQLTLEPNTSVANICLIGIGESDDVDNIDSKDSADSIDIPENFERNVSSQIIPFAKSYYCSSFSPTADDPFCGLDCSNCEWLLFYDTYYEMLPHTALAAQSLINDSKDEIDAAVFGTVLTNGQEQVGFSYVVGAPVMSDEHKYSELSNVLISRAFYEKCIAKLCSKLKTQTVLDAICEQLYLCDKKTYSDEILFSMQADSFRQVSLFNLDNNVCRICAISHEYSLTGAPIVFHNAIRTLASSGYKVSVISPSDGPMLESYLKDEISCTVYDNLFSLPAEFWQNIADNYDAVMISTVVGWHALRHFINLGIPVFWWIHDAEAGYLGYYKDAMPKRLPDNIHIYCGGEYALKVLLKYYPEYKAESLLYGLDDVSKTEYTPYPIDKNEKLLFSCIGSIEERKGQDILCDAIELLPNEIRQKCLFLFAGKSVHEKIKARVDEVLEKFPEQTKYIEQIPRESMCSIYAQSDCMVCASRDDPMPTFVVEGMMFDVPAICSENTGTAALIKEGECGFVYPDDSKEALAKAIESFVEMNPEDLSRMQTKARELFLNTFDKSKFEKKILEILRDMRK